MTLPRDIGTLLAAASCIWTTLWTWYLFHEWTCRARLWPSFVGRWPYR
jgi:hypothetical protein